MSSVIHNFELCDDEKTVQFQKTCVIVLGTTGTGKSSLIRLFCGNDVEVGHDTESKTAQSLLFSEQGNTCRYWLDSQGSNDSHEMDDDKVLMDILKQLYTAQVGKIHIIWCIDDGAICRAKGELKKQARFISILGENAWKSCIIIKKGGTAKPKGMDGVLAAAKQYGADIRNSDEHRLFGFTGLEYGNIGHDEHYQDWIQEYANDERRLKAKLSKFGYFTNAEITQHITRRLSQLASLQIRFIISRCNKCGIKGDKRFIYAPCHTAIEKYHPSATVPYHSGALRQFHTVRLHNYHSGHPQTHHNYESYHPGKWDDHVARNATFHLLTFGIHTIARAATDSFGDWTCCGSHNQSKAGCTQRIVSSYIKYSCCGGNGTAIGCRRKYNCCGGDVNHAGCRREYVCCNGTVNNAGCRRKHECCRNDLGSIGCKDRCQSCHRAWGNLPGCTKTTHNI